jgi:spore coat polysaccharide biosynthesis protein SpsF
MKKGILISCRTASKRLPNKAVLPINKKPSIYYLFENLNNSIYKDNLILCTTNLPSDDVLVDIAKEKSIKIFRGSSEDKLKRWDDCCDEFEIDFFINVDGDDLFFDYELADEILENYFEYDFVDGHGLYIDVYGIKSEYLKEVVTSKTTNNTEYVRNFLTKKNSKKILDLKTVIDKKYFKQKIRMTLDYEDDLLFFNNVIDNVNKLTYDNILEYIKKNPEVSNLNYYLDEKWKENQKKEFNL